MQKKEAHKPKSGQQRGGVLNRSQAIPKFNRSQVNQNSGDFHPNEELNFLNPLNELNKEVHSTGLHKPEYTRANALMPPLQMAFPMTNKIGEDMPTSDPMNELNKKVLAIGLPKPEYTSSSYGPPHETTFTTTCKIGENLFTSGRANSKKAAKKIAAAEMLEKLNYSRDFAFPSSSNDETVQHIASEHELGQQRSGNKNKNRGRGRGGQRGERGEFSGFTGGNPAFYESMVSLSSEPERMQRSDNINRGQPRGRGGPKNQHHNFEPEKYYDEGTQPIASGHGLQQSKRGKELRGRGRGGQRGGYQSLNHQKPNYHRSMEFLSGHPEIMQESNYENQGQPSHRGGYKNQRSNLELEKNNRSNYDQRNSNHPMSTNHQPTAGGASFPQGENKYQRHRQDQKNESPRFKNNENMPSNYQAFPERAASNNYGNLHVDMRQNKPLLPPPDFFQTEERHDKRKENLNFNMYQNQQLRQEPERFERGAQSTNKNKNSNFNKHQNHHQDRPYTHPQSSMPCEGDAKQLIQISVNQSLSYKELEAMQNFEPSHILRLFSSDDKEFEKLLEKDLDFDWYYLVLRLLAKISSSYVPDLHQSLFSDLLLKVKGSKFLRNFTIIVTQLSSGKKVDNKKVIHLHEDLVIFFRIFIEKDPSSAYDSVPEKYFEVINGMKMLLAINKYDVPQGIYEDLRLLQSMLDGIRRSFADKSKKKPGKRPPPMGLREELSYDEPPIDFRELSIVPTMEDLNSEKNPFLRCAIVSGAYENIDHYLDVQFRLLREDFYYPLKSGIKKYRSLLKDKKKVMGKIDDILVYHNVKFADYDVVNGSYTVSMNGLGHINWENSKRLMQGSLLCLSKDNFKTVIIATVFKRDENLLSQKGMVKIRIEESVGHHGNIVGTFTMAESSVYFEVYRNVLKVLKEYTETNFPFTEFILGQKMDAHLPGYVSKCLRAKTEPIYNLNALVPTGSNIESVNLLSFGRQLTAQQLSLDQSQFEALKLALTERVAIIHGPPGTGKTFIGLKVVETLLLNHHIWRVDKDFHPVKNPILIVCYTNHALDQFLEGILKFTKKVVRIGGMSKSEIVKPYALSQLRKNSRMKISQETYGHSVYEKRTEINAIVNQLREQNSVIGLVEKKIILHELDLLKNKIIPPDLARSFELLDQEFKSSNMSLWLGIHELRSLQFVLKNLENAGGHFQENQKSADQHEKEEEYEFEDIDVFERTRVVDDFNIQDPLEALISAEQGTISGSTILKNFFTVAWSEEMVNEKIESLEQHLKKNDVLGASRRQILADIERYTETRKVVLRILEIVTPISTEKLEAIMKSKNIVSLPYHERWMLYAKWRQDILDVLVDLREVVESKYKNLVEEIEDSSFKEDALYCASTDIVAATTSGCAKHMKLIKHLASKIVVMEEAAEVLEAHALVPLTSKCEHFILIGDHQQLRPSTSSYHLAKDYNLEVSMFERFINLGAEYVSLSLQHRMRPEIARLLVPVIYPDLRNHFTVQEFPSIKGMNKNVFFLSHQIFEKEDKEQKSHFNQHEAEIALNLAKYLTKQDYSQNQITILTTYSGQLLNLLQLRKKSFENLSKIRISVVDNYQGEENDIIILSLVRSNKDSNIGFLSSANRICVALSRAKHGLYIIGNMECLKSKCELWQSIYTTLNENYEIGNQLELVCQVHDTVTSITKASDFKTVAEGGCMEKCNAVLNCGHICPRNCHIRDRDHLQGRCSRSCDRYICSEKHQCPKKCFEECGKCVITIEKTLSCGHLATLPCCVDISDHKCLVMVEKTLPDCGHLGRVYCGVDPRGLLCSLPCNIPLSCGHLCTRKCHINDDPEHKKYVCKKKCEKKNKGCQGDHRCRRSCFEDCTKCDVSIKTTLPCGHETRVECGADIQKHICTVDVKQVLPKCLHSITYPCYIAQEHVKVMSGSSLQLTDDSSIISHKLVCQEPCGQKVECGHYCPNLCGDPCITPSQCLICNKIHEEKNKSDTEIRRRQLETYQEIAKQKALEYRDETTRFKVSGLHPSSSVFLDVRDKVVKYIQPTHGWHPEVISVQEVFNANLLEAFHSCQANLFEPSTSREKFHGTNAEACEKIIYDGFQLPSNDGQQLMFGCGIYFATDSSKSAQQIHTKGSNILILCDVLLGREMKVSKPQNEMNCGTIRSLGYDSLFSPRDTKNTDGVLFDGFVIYDPRQAYPRYVINYRVTQMGVPVGSLVSDKFQKYEIFPSRSFDPSNELDYHFRVAEAQFRRLCKNRDVVKVTYVINPALEAQFSETSKEFAVKYGPGADEAKPILAFHGTPVEKNIDSILSKNFQSSYIRRTAYGHGHYFSEFPETALGYAGRVKALILCKILAGRSQDVGGNATLAHGFESLRVGKDAHGRGTMIIINNEKQILPCYVVHLG